MAETKEYIEEVAARTKLARKSSGFKTQADIAEKLKIDRARYAKFETERIVAKELIAKFCELTGVSEKWLLTGEGPMQGESPKTPAMKILDSIIADLGEAEIITLADIAKALKKQKGNADNE